MRCNGISAPGRETRPAAGQGAEDVWGFPVASFLLRYGGDRKTVFWNPGSTPLLPSSFPQGKFLLFLPPAAIHPPSLPPQLLRGNISQPPKQEAKFPERVTLSAYVRSSGASSWNLRGPIFASTRGNPDTGRNFKNAGWLLVGIGESKTKTKLRTRPEGKRDISVSVRNCPHEGAQAESRKR